MYYPMSDTAAIAAAVALISGNHHLVAMSQR
jgi:hypothetical protein